MFRVVSLLLMAAVVAFAPAASLAQPMRLGLLQPFERPGRGVLRGPEASAAQGVREGRLIPLARVLQQIEARYPGRLLDAALVDQGRQVYRVRWATNDGRRLDVVVDASSGQILSAE